MINLIFVLQVCLVAMKLTKVLKASWLKIFTPSIALFIMFVLLTGLYCVGDMINA